MRSVLKHLLVLWLLALSGLPAFAQQGAIVTVLQGRVTVEQGAPVPAAASALMKLRTGDRVQLAADATVQLVYFSNGHQETWRGAARFEVGEAESRLGSGEAPQTKQLPMMLVRQLVKTPAADATGRVGAVRMRSIVPPDAAAKLETGYRELRAQAAADDRTPELYYLAGLFELKEYARIESLLDEWLRAAPGDANLVALKEHYGAAIRNAPKQSGAN